MHKIYLFFTSKNTIFQPFQKNHFFRKKRGLLIKWRVLTKTRHFIKPPFSLLRNPFSASQKPLNQAYHTQKPCNLVQKNTKNDDFTLKKALFYKTLLYPTNCKNRLFRRFLRFFVKQTCNSQTLTKNHALSTRKHPFLSLFRRNFHFFHYFTPQICSVYSYKTPLFF